MKRILELGNPIRLILGIIAVCIIGGLLFSVTACSQDNRPLLIEVGEKIKTTEAPRNEYDVSFKKEKDSDKVANVWIFVEDTGRDFYRISFNVWHEEDTTLKGLTLDFNNIEPASALMLSTPGGYPVPLLEFHSIVPTSKGVTLNVEDFGQIGEGSVNFEFYLNGDGMREVPDNIIDLTLSLRLQEKRGLISKELFGEVPINIELP